jgi:acetylornithine deacetylase
MPDVRAQVKARLAELVALPSVSALDPAHDMSNVGVVDRLAEWFEAAGFAVTRQAVASAPAKVNFVARAGHGSGGLVLSGHTDTVPYDAGRWQTDPFTLVERDERWYGLGSADMKCFFPIVLAALEGIAPRDLRHPLTVVGTADEESSMAGARVLLREHLGDCRHALIGEPTALVPIRKHKGIVIGRVEIRGRSGHSSDPALGASALDCMHEVMSGFKAWRDAARERYRDPDFRVPHPTLNLGAIRGGDSPNRICARCELLFDVRVTPAMDSAAATRELAAIVETAAAAAGVEGVLVLPVEPVPPLETAAGADIVRAVEALAGTPARTVAFATEGPYLEALGCETVVFGPGDIDCAHQPDEAVEVARALRMVGIVRALIERFCCHD